MFATRPTPLSRAIAFLHSEYKPAFYWVRRGLRASADPVPFAVALSKAGVRLACAQWELMEMARRFVLVGIFVRVAPGSIEQVVSATFGRPGSDFDATQVRLGRDLGAL